MLVAFFTDRRNIRRIAGKLARAIPALVFGATAIVHAEFWVLPEVPGGAEIVEYIATGKDAGAYFDTGIKGANDMTTRVECAYTTLPTANSGIFGNATTPKRYCIYYIHKKKSFGVGMGSGSTDGTGWKETFIAPVAGTRYDFEIASGIGANSGAIRINDLYYTMGNTDTGAWSTSDNLRIFRSYGSSTYATYTRLYALRISSAAGTLRNYIPVVRNNVSCLYDTVSGTFLLKGGNPAISCGPIVTNAIEQLSDVQHQTFCRLLDDPDSSYPAQTEISARRRRRMALTWTSRPDLTSPCPSRPRTTSSTTVPRASAAPATSAMRSTRPPARAPRSARAARRRRSPTRTPAPRNSSGSGASQTA